MDIYDELTFTKAKDADIKRENANIDADTAMGTMLKYGSEGSKYFITSHILPKDIAVAQDVYKRQCKATPAKIAQAKIPI